MERITPVEPVAGVILSGGKNLRMGTNKAFLQVDGVRMIDRAVGILREVCGEIIIVTNEPLDYLDLDATVVTDIFKGMGPLAGIHSGLFHARAPRAFVCACDMPYLDASFIRHLAFLAEGYDIVVPVRGGRPEPLHAVYDRKCLPVIRRLLERDERKVTGFYKGFRVRDVEEAETEPFFAGRDPFLNVNTREQLRDLPKTT
ncbi:MAG: molybdenum cofactor guanylyltransferase [Deltaproteobacteria bacterium HGW-Deltaproteobacteria-19]|jgi:molybdopterin-guanine dinucleotide biosynthesis protein A|nr:MAG: molybdenum cofactor guanylyltransferase [Deltaproteobacteria bacterium HGW-Deltaproteobacteria-19]